MQLQETVYPNGMKTTLIHFVSDMDGTERVGCSPYVTNFAARGHEGDRPVPWHRTNDMTAVTCQECKESALYRQTRELHMRVVDIRLLPDGSGRVRIHFFVRDDDGPIKTPGSVAMTGLGPLPFGGVKGRIACMPKLASVSPTIQGGAIKPVCHSDDIRGVTCPECLATQDAREMQRNLSELLNQPIDQSKAVEAGVVEEAVSR